MRIKINNRMKGTVEYRNLDERFNERKWSEGSDSRINTRKRNRKPRRAYNGHFNLKFNAWEWTQLCFLGFCIFLAYLAIKNA